MTVSATVRHVHPGGEVEVETSDQPPWDDEHVDWRLVTDWMHRALRPGRLAFPLVLTADKWERDVLVDGVPVRFVFVGGDDAWCALGSPGGREVAVTGTGWPHDDLALTTVDPRAVSQDD